MSTISPMSTNFSIKHEGIFWVVYVNDLFVKRFKTEAEAIAYAETL